MLRKVIFQVLAVSLIMLFVSSLALADSLNSRPVLLGDNGSEDTLQEVFNNITKSGPGIDAYNDQSTVALFTNQSSGGSVATMIIELAGWASTNTFGIYDASDPTNKAMIFSGGDSQGAQALISFWADGTISVNGSDVATGFSSNFGFYLGLNDAQGKSLGYWYSEDSLNNGSAQFLAYNGGNGTSLQLPGYKEGLFSSDEWILAFEDTSYKSGDHDFNDLVVMVESVSPVPEPASMLLLGLGLFGIGLVSRKKR